MLLLLLACTPRQPWWSELQPDSPCYRVDLADGVDEADTTELHELFACLNRGGHLDAWQPIDELLEEPSGGGLVGHDLARWTNAMTDEDADPLFILSTAIRLVASEEQDADAWFDLWLEVGWGRPAHEVRSGRVPLNAGLQGGLLEPLIPGVQRLAGDLHGDPDGSLAWLAEQLPGARRWIRTAAGWQASTDAWAAASHLPRELGVTLQRTRSPGNDRWADASGDSLRDVVEAIVDQDVAKAIAPPASTLLADDLARANFESALIQMHADGDLQQLLPQLERLVAVNRQGELAAPGEDSALRSFIRLVARGNEPMVCTVDLGLFEVPLSFGNVSVSVLELLADLDPDAAQDATGILSDLLGFGFTEAIIEQVASSGTCPPLDTQLVADLRAVDAMQEPETRAVFVVLVRLAKAAKDGEQSQVPALVDALTVLEDRQLIEPLEELARDIGPTVFAEDVVGLVPVLARPGTYGISASPDEPIALVDVLDGLEELMQERDGTSGLEHLQALLEPAVAEEGTWIALHRGVDLLADPQSRTSQVLAFAGPLVAADPELDIVRVGRPLFDVPGIRDPLLTLVAHPEVLPVVLGPNPGEGQELAPLAFFGERVLDDTAVDLVRTLAALRSGLWDPQP